MVISIHSPYTGRDGDLRDSARVNRNFNPLSLYRERLQAPSAKQTRRVFQSTLPIQGETLAGKCLTQSIQYFNPLSLYRERRSLTVRPPPPCQFQSTLPIQGETRHLVIYRVRGGISIHSPYTGRDFKGLRYFFANSISIHSPYTGRDYSWHPSPPPSFHFNPLSLYRERHRGPNCFKQIQVFQSTLPIQGETQCL